MRCRLLASGLWLCLHICHCLSLRNRDLPRLKRCPIRRSSLSLIVSSMHLLAAANDHGVRRITMAMNFTVSVSRMEASQLTDTIALTDLHGTTLCVLRVTVSQLVLHICLPCASHTPRLVICASLLSFITPHRGASTDVSAAGRCCRIS
jgi:hypothetical protein